MTLDKDTNFKKKSLIIHVNINFRCSDSNQKHAVLLLPISSLSFEFHVSETYGCETYGGTYTYT